MKSARISNASITPIFVLTYVGVRLGGASPFADAATPLPPTENAVIPKTLPNRTCRISYRIWTSADDEGVPVEAVPGAAQRDLGR